LNRTVRWLVALGFALRLALGGCLGTIDMDWWKSWVVYGYEQSLTSLYGSSDAEIAENIGLGMNLAELRLNNARLVPYRVNYGTFSEVRGLWVAQPPLYVYALMLAGGVYRLASGGLEDGRWFNFCINLLNLASAAGTAWLIYGFWRRNCRPDLAVPTALAYWLNPLVLLNAPVQGYLDQLCAVFLVWSFIQLYERRLLAAYALFAVSLLMKPTGVVVLPLLLVIGLREHGFRANVRGTLVALAVTVLSFMPFLVAGQGLSVLVGLSQLGAQLDVVCRKAINLWYPVQYFALERAGFPWWSQFSNEAFGAFAGARVDRVGAFLFLLFTILNLASCWKTLDDERWVLFSSAGLQVLASYVLRTGQHVNHYFLAIPLLAVVALTSRRRLACFVASCALFFTADVIFYGFGRDTPQYSELLAARGWIGVTVVLAIGNVLVSMLSYRAHFPRAEPRRWLRGWLAARGIGSA
jgi:hypothetical protein